MTTFQVLDDEILYPSSDGEPMADSTKQYEWIVRIKENLERLFAGDRNVFIAADLLWYPQQVAEPPASQQAPDVMVIFGRPKGHRKSYRQWTENNIAPQVVFEILSASNKTRAGLEKMDEKLLFYQRYGVEEYYIYDPDEYTLEAYLRQGDRLTPLPLTDLTQWRSPRLGIWLQWQPGQDLTILYPDRRPFLSFVELARFADFQSDRADRAEAAVQQANVQLKTIARNLQASGLEAEAIAQVMGLPADQLQTLLLEDNKT